MEVQERKARYLYDKKLGTLSKLKKKSIEFRREERQKEFVAKRLKNCSCKVLMML